MEFIADRSFTKQCMRAWNYIQKTAGSPLNIKTIKQPRKIMMGKEKHQDRKDVLVEECRKSSAFAGYHIFAPAGLIEKYMEGAIFRFHETKKDDPIMAAKNLFGNIINIHPFEHGNRRISRLILAHVLFFVLFTSFRLLFR